MLMIGLSNTEKKKKNQSRFDETNIGFLFSCKSEKQKKTVFGFIQ